MTVFVNEANVDKEVLQEFARAYWAQFDMEPVFRNATYSQRCADVI